MMKPIKITIELDWHVGQRLMSRRGYDDTTKLIMAFREAMDKAEANRKTPYERSKRQ